MVLKLNPITGDLDLVEDLSETIQLTSLSDVELTGVANNNVLQYNSTSGNWENVPAAGNDSIAIHDNVSGEINAVTAKTTPVGADLVLIEDSAATFEKKELSLTNLSKAIDHGSMLGLTDDDHTQYLLVDGTRAMTATLVLDSEHDNGNSGTSDTIDWGVGNLQKSTLTGNVTYTFTAPDGPCMISLRIIQDATGSRTVTWPAAVEWPGGIAPVLTTTASAEDVVTFRYDGTNYIGVGVSFNVQ